MSDPERNPNFRRKWDAPPLKSKAPPADGTARQGNLENTTISSNEDIAPAKEEFKPGGVSSSSKGEV